MTRRLKNSLQTEFILWLLFLPFWILGTVCLGVVALWKLGRWIRRLRLSSREVAQCARGHTVPLFGVYECACGAIHEGRVFGECPICHETCGWTPCSECGLPVGNPLLR